MRIPNKIMNLSISIPTKVKLTLIKNAPGICIGAGIVLAIGSAVYACKNRSRKYFKAFERRTGYYTPSDIILPTKVGAMDVLDELNFIIRKYGEASVADYYDLVGLTGDWKDTHYGWESLSDAVIKPIHDGFLILMPRAHRLSND